MGKLNRDPNLTTKVDALRDKFNAAYSYFIIGKKTEFDQKFKEYDDLMHYIKDISGSVPGLDYANIEDEEWAKGDAEQEIVSIILSIDVEGLKLPITFNLATGRLTGHNENGDYVTYVDKGLAMYVLGSYMHEFKQQKKSISVRVPMDNALKLELMADKKKTTVSGLINKLIDEYVNK